MTSRNRQLVPRFFITYPKSDPALPLSILKQIQLSPYDTFGLQPGTGRCPLSPLYNDTVLLEVLHNFIAAYGAKYDGDKRIAYVQAGLLGYWGEYHTLNNPWLLPDFVRSDVL